MAGDWIKMREALHEDPAILVIARELGTRPEHVVGYCHKFWSWVSRNMCRDSVPNLSPESLDSVLNLPGFCALLEKVGWLESGHDDAGISFIRIPNYDRHLSQSAKSRALAAEKKRSQRTKDVPHSVPKVSPIIGDRIGTREEKRREEKNKELPSEACGEPAKAASPPLALAPLSRFRFPVRPSKGRPETTWVLPQSNLDEYASVYEAEFVAAEFGKATLWLSSYAERRKTAGGMLKFLTGWLNRAVNDSRPARGSPAAYDRRDEENKALQAIEAFDNEHERFNRDDQPLLRDLRPKA